MNILPPAIAGTRGIHRFRLLLAVQVLIILNPEKTPCYETGDFGCDQSFFPKSYS